MQRHFTQVREAVAWQVLTTKACKAFCNKHVVWEHIFLQSLCHPLSICAQCIVSRPKQSFQQPQKCQRWVMLLWTRDVPWLPKLETISMESRAQIESTAANDLLFLDHHLLLLNAFEGNLNCSLFLSRVD